ncbi:hypothetical protein MrNuV_ORF048 [Macrobrachium rosenbergii nudivirus]|nr:hypothetical protein MrNuV_ORF048 [Macrobrachium rosenbergii nudivirus]
MLLLDIFEFIYNYNSKSPETLLLWLQNYEYYDQLLFIQFLLRKDKQFHNLNNKNLLNIHRQCTCQIVYDKIFKNTSFYQVIDNVNFLRKCVEVEENKIQPKYIDISKSNVFNFKQERRVIQYVQKEIKKRPVKEIKIRLQLNDKVSRDHITLQDLELIQPHKLIERVNVYELYVLLYAHLIITLRTIDVLLPEYLRVETLRNNKKLNTIDPESILINLYNFYNGFNICQVDTNMRFGIILPKLKELEKVYDDSENYYYQPKISGIRVLLHKHSNGKIIIYNKYNVKILYKFDPLELLGTNDFDNFYAGEFIIVLVSKRDENIYFNKKELLKYLNTTVPPVPDKKLKLILIDLYLWNGVNLLINTYEKRQPILKLFSESITGVQVISNDYSISNLYAIYDKYLQSKDINDSPVIEGVVMRQKNTIFEAEMEYVNFNTYMQKYLIISNYNVKIKTFRKNDLPYIIPENVKVCVYQNMPNCAKYENIACFELSKTEIKLAKFIKNKFYHVLTLRNTLEDFEIYKKFMNGCIIIDNKKYNYVIVKLGYDEFSNVQFIEFRKDKSILDCFAC